MSFLAYAALFGAVLLGGAAGLAFPTWRGRVLHLVLCFSGAYLLGITVLHLMPEAFADGVGPDGLYTGLAILGGFFLQVVLERFSSGVEHGHIHVERGERVALSVLFGLSLHALLEGAPLPHVGEARPGVAVADLVAAHDHLLAGIMIHKLPAGFALSVLLAQAGYGRVAVWGLLVAFAAMTPLGALLSTRLVSPAVEPYVLGLVIGSLLHVSTTILFELDDAQRHRLTWVKTAAIAAGIAGAVLTAFA